jgi:hypothetical protein
MANLQVKDGAAATKYLKATGAGSDGDPAIVEHEVTQATHDDLNLNANLQVANADVANGNPVPISDAGGALTVDGTVTVQDGGGAITVDDGATTLSVDDGAGSLTVDGTVTANLSPTTSGGLSIFRSIDLDESEEEVKGSAGQVYGAYLYNAASSGKRYIKFYNDTAANVTVGTTAPVLTLPLDAGQGAVLSFEHGLTFSAAITVAATTGVADNDTGAPGANEVIANIFYK